MAEAAAPFFWGSGGERLTPAQIAKRRQVEEALAEKGSDYSPVQHWTQGLARVSNALVGALSEKKTAAAERANSAEDAGLLKGLLGGTGGSPAPAVAMPTAGDAPSQKVSYAPGGDSDPNPALDAIMKFESGGKNIHQNVVPAGGGFNPSTGTVTGPSSAQGYFQMITPTWRSAAQLAGIDTSQYPTAMTAPYELQRKAAAALYAKEGFAPWAPYNAALRAHIAKNGLNAPPAPAPADMPAPGAAPAEAPAGQPGFAVPPAEPVQPAPMDPQTFAAIQGGKPLDPVFQTEGVSQPWMGTAVAPQPQAAPQVAQAPMPPARPADLPAPGAVEAIGQMPPQAEPPPMPSYAGAEDAGMRQLQVISEERRRGLPSAPAAGNSPLDTVMAAFTGGGQPAPAAAPQSPAVAKVAQAVAQNPGDPIVQALTSPYSSDATKRVAMAMLTKKIEGQTRPQWSEQTLPDGSLAQRNSQTGEMKIIRPGVNPLDAEGKKLDIETKKKNLGKAEAPTVQRVKQPDGSEVAVQWDQASGSWVPLKAPEGGNAVKAPGKLTEQQSKDVGFYNRGSKIVDRLDTQDAALKDTLSALGGNVSNYLKSDAYRQAEQTGRELLAVILRKDTGAAVTDKEMELYGNIYLPKPGDDDQTVMQKRFARRNAMEGLKMGLGPAEILFNSQNTPMPAQKGAAPSGQTKSGVKWSVE